jgi:phosphonate transport system substrate-binding protein
MMIGNSGRAGNGLGWRPAWFAAQAFCLAASSLPAFAGWQEDIGTFRIGIVAEPGSGNGIAGLATLNDAFAKALGMKVEFLVARSYPALIDAQVSARIDYAVYSAAAYAAAYERCGCIEPLVAPSDESGALGIRSILVTKDGRLASASDLAGRRIALLPPDSMAGHQLPLASFSPNGRRLSGEENFFITAQSAEAAEAMLVEGSVDALFGWEPGGPAASAQIAGGTLQRLVDAGVDPEALSVVWRSDLLRYGPHAVSTRLDPEPRERLAAFLIGLRQSDPVLYETLESRHLGGFAAASSADYAAALEIIRLLAGASDQE